MIEAGQLARSSQGTPLADAGTLSATQQFLAGNGLPSRWQGRERFVILQAGFGAGLDFLAAWAAWRADPARCERLHFIALEAGPLSGADLDALYRHLSAFPGFAPLQACALELLAHWPQLLPGFQRLHFDDEGVTLTLVFGQIAAQLPQIVATVHAFALGPLGQQGELPAEDAEAGQGITAALTRLAAPGATLSSEAGPALRENLSALGWSTRPWPTSENGAFVAHWPGSPPPKKPAATGFSISSAQAGEQCGRPDAVPRAVIMAEHAASSSPEKRAIVLGAGIAGSSAAERLAARGWQVELIDAAAGPGEGASGNRAGVLRPLPSLDDNRLARLTRACFLYTRRHLAAVTAAGQPLRWGETGVLHLARDDTHEATQKRVVEAHQAPTDYLRYVEREEAAQIAGWPVAAGGWWFPGGAWVQPPSACRANIARHGERVRTHYGRHVATIVRENGQWQALAADGTLIAAAPVLVLANAADATKFSPAAYLPLQPARGQVTHLPADDKAAPNVVVCRLGYVTPGVDGTRCAGATFLLNDPETALRPAEHSENLAKLDFILPGFSQTLPADATPESLEGRVGFRPVSPDRLPIVGAVADAAAIDPALPSRPLADIPRIPGLFMINGFGARGIVWSALAAELLACRINGEPLPLEAELVDALDPARFLLRGKNRRRPPREESGSEG